MCGKISCTQGYLIRYYYFMFIYKLDFNVNINKERVLKKYVSRYLKKSGYYSMI